MRQVSGGKYQAASSKSQREASHYQVDIHNATRPFTTLRDHSQFAISLLLLSFLIILIGCGPAATAAQITITPTPTAPPPPPRPAYTPVLENTVSPVIVQRQPRRGEELAPDQPIELIFDRAMNQEAVAQAFNLQLAAKSPQPVEGKITWPTERTMRFTPAQPLERAAVYDAVLTQAAAAKDGAPLAEPFTFRFSTFGYLEVGQVIPADGTADAQTRPTITVMFNRPVVPLTSLEEAKKFPQPLEFEPAISGQGDWLNTSIYTFVPDKDLPGGVTLKPKLRPG